MIPTSQLRFLVFGVGAIGTYVGGSLSLIGQKVVFVDRPGIAQEIHERGLTLGLSNGDNHIQRPDVVSSLDQALTHGPFDLAILAVKAYDTPNLLHNLAPYLVALPPVLCLQNGVENEAELTRLLGEDRVIAGSVTTAIGKSDSGRVFVERLRGIGLASTHVLSTLLFDLFNQAGLHAHLYGNPAGMKWSKMITNLLANASSAILDMTPAEIFDDPNVYRMEMQMMREALKVMDAQSIPVIDLPDTPVRPLTWMIRNLPAGFSQPILRKALASGRGAKMPSFHIDLASGKGKSEVEYLNGAVVRFGERLGIGTPVNKVLTDVLMKLTRGEINQDEYRQQPAKLIALLEK